MLYNGSIDKLHIYSQVWDALLAKSPLDYLVAASTPFLGIWVYLIMQPTRLPYDPNVLIEAKHRARVSEIGTYN